MDGTFTFKTLFKQQTINNKRLKTYIYTHTIRNNILCYRLFFQENGKYKVVY